MMRREQSVGTVGANRAYCDENVADAIRWLGLRGEWSKRQAGTSAAQSATGNAATRNRCDRQLGCLCHVCLLGASSSWAASFRQPFRI